MIETDYINIGPVPAEESCQQCGTPGYDPVAAREECRRFRDLIRSRLGPEPEGAGLVVRGFEHDFGRYYEVCCEYDPDVPGAAEYALRCESEAPSRWLD